MGFSAGDVRRFNTGSAIVTSLDTSVREELAHVGAVYVDAPPARFVERFRDVERFESGPGVPLIGRFSRVPQREDMATLTLPISDVATLPRCRPGHCDVKLSATAMRRFQTDVDWSSARATDHANDIFRTMLRDLVRAYQVVGNAALGQYDDGDEPLPVDEQFRALLANDDQLPAPAPALMAYLDDYPRGRPPGVEDFFYWSVVDFGLKLTIRVNHVMIFPLAAESSDFAYAIAIKQLYASHYFRTALELRFLIDDGQRPGQSGTSLISVFRARNDGNTGFRGLFLRPIISRRSRDGALRYLEHVKRQVERPSVTIP